MGSNRIKKRKIKYRSIVFKVTDRQKRIIDDYCRRSGLSTIQLFKLAMRDYLARNASFEQPGEVDLISENQLTIFDVIREVELEA